MREWHRVRTVSRITWKDLLGVHRTESVRVNKCLNAVFEYESLWSLIFRCKARVRTVKGKDDLTVISLEHNHMKKLGRRTKGELEKIKAQRNSKADENWIIMSSEIGTKLNRFHDVGCNNNEWNKICHNYSTIMDNWINKLKSVVIGSNAIINFILSQLSFLCSNTERYNFLFNFINSLTYVSIQGQIESEILEENPVVGNMVIEAASTSSSLAEAASLSAEQESTYYYNRKGQLMINGYKFIRGMVNGNSNTIYWRCGQSKKFKCNARVKSKGKLIVAQNVVHNHDPRRETAFSAIVWDASEASDDWNIQLKPNLFSTTYYY